MSKNAHCEINIKCFQVLSMFEQITSTLYSASSVRMWAENSSPSMCACTRECSSPVEIANNDMSMYDNKSQMEKQENSVLSQG